MQTIATSELRANLMKILKKIESDSIINITSRGRLVARLVPPDNSRKISRKRLAELSKTAIVKDVVSPIDEDWDALK